LLVQAVSGARLVLAQQRAATHILLTRALVVGVGEIREDITLIYWVAPTLFLAATGQAAGVMAGVLLKLLQGDMDLLEVVALEVTLAQVAMGAMTEL
jgi:hypothetical protein